MKFIKKVFGKIKFLLYYNYSLLRIIIVSLTNKNRVYNYKNSLAYNNNKYWAK